MESIRETIENLSVAARSATEYELSHISGPTPEEAKDYETLEAYAAKNELVKPFSFDGKRKFLITPKGQQLIENIVKKWMILRQEQHCMRSPKIYVHQSTFNVKIEFCGGMLGLGSDMDISFMRQVMAYYKPVPYGFKNVEELLYKKKLQIPFRTIAHHPSLWSFDRMRVVISSLDVLMFNMTDIDSKEIVEFMIHFVSHGIIQAWSTRIPKNTAYEQVYKHFQSNLREDTQQKSQSSSILGLIFYMRHCYAHLWEYDPNLSSNEIGMQLYSTFGDLFCLLICGMNYVCKGPIFDAVNWKFNSI